MPRLKINRQGVVRLREQIRPHRMKSVIAIPQKRNISLNRVKNRQLGLKCHVKQNRGECNAVKKRKAKTWPKTITGSGYQQTGKSRHKHKMRNTKHEDESRFKIYES